MQANVPSLCVRGGEQFVAPSYCLPLVVVVSGLPSTSLIYTKKGGQKPPLCHLSDCHISCRESYTLVRQVLGHSIIPVLRDRDDHLLQSLTYGVLPNLRDREVHFQCGDVVVGW